MKKIITSMMLFAAAAMAFVSCQKNEFAPKYEQTILTFTSANPTTKTEWNGETIIWSAKDKIKMALMIGNSWYTDANGKPKYYVSDEADLSDDSMTATFKISSSFKTELTGDYQFYALYPSDCTGSSTDFTNAPNASYTIAAEQVASSQTFDKSADILWGRAVDTYTSLPTDEQVSLMWNRLVAHAYVTLKGLPAGETVNRVTLTAQEGAALVGKYNVDITTGVVSENTPANSVLVNCEGVTVDQNGNATFWACINPCNITSLNIVVDTDKAVYSIDKTNLDLDFLVNRRNIQPINMADAERVEKVPMTNVYRKVSSAPANWCGRYLLVAEKSNNSYIFNQNITGDWGKLTSVTIEDDTISTEPSYEITIEEGTEVGTYALRLADGMYLSASAKNKLNTSVSKIGNTNMVITLQTDGTVIIALNGKSARTLQCNASLSYGFHFYDSGNQVNPQLYRLED